MDGGGADFPEHRGAAGDEDAPGRVVRRAAEGHGAASDFDGHAGVVATVEDSVVGAAIQDAQRLAAARRGLHLRVGRGAVERVDGFAVAVEREE